jgi:hypothetical protein
MDKKGLFCQKEVYHKLFLNGKEAKNDRLFSRSGGKGSTT